MAGFLPDSWDTHLWSPDTPHKKPVTVKPASWRDDVGVAMPGNPRETSPDS